MKIWSEKYECMDREEMSALQSRRLHDTVKKVYEKVPFYKKKLDEAGIKPNDITSIDQLVDIPFTVKDDLRVNYPFGMFAEPKDKLVRIHASSGTTGKPTVVGYTKNDLEVWTEVVARLVTAAGAEEKDTAQVAFGYGLFTGGFGLHYGLERIGATVVPISSGNTERSLMLMKDFGSTILVATPTYALYMAETAAKMGLDPKDTPLRLGLFGAEPSTEEMRAELEERWGISATENYGLSEIIGPGVSGECIYKCGMHIAEDHFLPEIIDPDTGVVLPHGEMGELVLTTITKEGLPILRYRTKDITSLVYDKCECGRTSVRMTRVQGRCDDMLIIRGVNVFPSQIESVLMGMEEVGPHYEIIVKRENYMDTIEVKVEVIDGKYLESYRKLEELENKIKYNLRTVLSLDAKVGLVEPETLKRFTGKAKRVVDLRNE